LVITVAELFIFLF
jgi:hypothetical protein